MAASNIRDISHKCRFLKHAWDTYVPAAPYPSMYRNVIHLSCMRCGTTRHDAMDTNGSLAARKYDYPEGYRMTEDERPTTEQLRKWMFNKYRKEIKKAGPVITVAVAPEPERELVSV